MSDVAELPRAELGGPRSAGPEPSLRDGVVSLLVIVLVVGAAAAPRLMQRFGRQPSAAECAALVDRYVEQASLARDPKAREAQLHEQLAALAGQPVRQRQLASCEQTLAPAQVACALGSPNVDELERCLQ